MGGGGGPDGFRHVVKHLGPARETWAKDMAAHAYSYTDANLDILDVSVQDMLKGVDMKKLQEERDELMAELLKLRATTSQLS